MYYIVGVLAVCLPALQPPLAAAAGEIAVVPHIPHSLDSRKIGVSDCRQCFDRRSQQMKIQPVAYRITIAPLQNLDSSEISLTDVSHYFDSDPTKLVSGLRKDGKMPSSYIAGGWCNACPALHAQGCSASSTAVTIASSEYMPCTGHACAEVCFAPPPLADGVSMLQTRRRQTRRSARWQRQFAWTPGVSTHPTRSLLGPTTDFMTRISVQIALVTLRLMQHMVRTVPPLWIWSGDALKLQFPSVVTPPLLQDEAAEPQVVRGHAGQRLRGRARDPEAADQHHGLVRHLRHRGQLGVRRGQQVRVLLCISVKSSFRLHPWTAGALT